MWAMGNHWNSDQESFLILNFVQNMADIGFIWQKVLQNKKKELKYKWE